MTSRQILLQAAAELRACGVPDPAYDAAALLSRVTGDNPLELRAGFDREVSAGDLESFRGLLACRKNREPLQYILGDAVFMGDAYRVRPGVLIPRPETEMLAEEGIAFLAGRHPEGRDVLDLCCGSGCLGIAVKRHVPDARCVLSDLSSAALDTARENAAALGADCTFLSGDLFAPLAGRAFDLILCNPPYIPSRDCDTLQPEVMREPRLALDGGEEGLNFYIRLAEESKMHLKPGGRLLLEIGAGQATAVTALFRRAGAERVRTEQDFSGIPRMIAVEYEGIDETCPV